MATGGRKVILSSRYSQIMLIKATQLTQQGLGKKWKCDRHGDTGLSSQHWDGRLKHGDHNFKATSSYTPNTRTARNIEQVIRKGEGRKGGGRRRGRNWRERRDRKMGKKKREREGKRRGGGGMREDGEKRREEIKLGEARQEIWSYSTRTPALERLR